MANRGKASTAGPSISLVSLVSLALSPSLSPSPPPPPQVGKRQASTRSSHGAEARLPRANAFCWLLLSLVRPPVEKARVSYRLSYLLSSVLSTNIWRRREQRNRRLCCRVIRCSMFPRCPPPSPPTAMQPTWLSPLAHFLSGQKSDTSQYEEARSQDPKLHRKEEAWGLERREERHQGGGAVNDGGGGMKEKGTALSGLVREARGTFFSSPSPSVVLPCPLPFVPWSSMDCALVVVPFRGWVVGWLRFAFFFPDFYFYFVLLVFSFLVFFSFCSPSPVQACIARPSHHNMLTTTPSHSIVGRCLCVRNHSLPCL